MTLIVGIILALVVGLFGHAVGFDRDKAFYPVVLIVVASYYVLFAVMGAEAHELLAEMAIFGLFAGVAVAGFRWSSWLVVGGLASHGLFDFARHSFLEGRGVPQWWPGFCLAYDLTAAAGLATLLVVRRRRRA